MKEEWQHQSSISVEPLPELPPPESEDDMARARKETPTVTAVFTVDAVAVKAWLDAPVAGR